jgi:hypothetical protein
MHARAIAKLKLGDAEVTRRRELLPERRALPGTAELLAELKGEGLPHGRRPAVAVVAVELVVLAWLRYTFFQTSFGSDYLRTHCWARRRCQLTRYMRRSARRERPANETDEEGQSTPRSVVVVSLRVEWPSSLLQGSKRGLDVVRVDVPHAVDVEPRAPAEGRGRSAAPPKKPSPADPKAYRT